MSAATLDEPLGVTARNDLTVQPQIFRGRRHWCIKDPVSLAYFHLRDEEYAILQAIKKRASMSSVLGAFRQKFPGQAIDAEQVRLFLAGLYRNGLVTVERSGQGDALWGRREQTRRRAWLSALPGLLAIRFRGIDPTSLLRAAYDLLWWVFSPAALTAGVLCIFGALAIVVTRFDQIVASLPAAESFFGTREIVLFFAAMGLIKVLHEIGHGLTCLRLGGECHEMGVMLLVFAPCLYCDVSDSWLFESKWRRIAVAAAGIVVELMLAALATFAWALSEPGLFHAFCINIMLICSVNTLLFNGNPLLRYDGYFVLSDLVEVPNLAAEARAAVSRLILGRDGANPPFDRGELSLLAFGIASALYRVFVTGAIIWFCLKMLTPWGLAPFGYLLGAMCLVGLVASPVAALGRAAVAPRPRRGRALLGLAVIGGATALALFVPLPHRIEVPAILRPQEATAIFLPVGGEIVETTAAGTTVERGEVIGRLRDASLDADVAQLETRLAELRAQIDVLRSRRLADPALAAHLPATQEAADAAERQLAQRIKDRAELTVVSPRPGIVLPPPMRLTSDAEDQLATWSGTPLDTGNLNCFLEPGTLFCLVGAPHRLEAVALVEEGSVAFLRPGQRVRLKFDQTAGQTLDGRVQAIATDPLTTVPPEFARGSQFPMRRNADGVLRPTQTTYEVKVQLEGIDGSRLRIRGTGQARIEAGSERLFDRFYRFLRRTFRFEL